MHDALIVIEQEVVLQGELGLGQSARMADDVRPPVAQRLGRQRRLAPLSGDDARAAITAAVTRLSTPDTGPAAVVPTQRTQ